MAAAQTEMEQAETAPKEQEAPCTVQEPKEITALAVIRPLDMADLIAAPHTETTAAEIPEEKHTGSRSGQPAGNFKRLYR